MSSKGVTAQQPPQGGDGSAGVANDNNMVTHHGLSAASNIPNKVRANTWSDAELEDLYDIKNLNAEIALRTKHLLGVLKAIRHCNKAKRLEDAIKVIVDNTCQILGCDRATLFIVDPSRNELVIRNAVGVQDVRISLATKSIAGSVYHSGMKANIPDAYLDERFNLEVDVKTGYRTKSILSAPIWDEYCKPVAVLQVVNKLKSSVLINSDDDKELNTAESEDEKSPRPKALRFLRHLTKGRKDAGGFSDSNNAASSEDGHDGSSRPTNMDKYVPFTTEDEVLMDHLSLQLGVILRNQMLREESERRHTQVLSMLDIVKSLHSNMGVNSLMFTITERSPALVDASRCTLYVVDHKHQELWSLQGAIEIRVPMDKGLVGYTATTGETINVEDAHQDERFNTEFDLKTGFHTKQALVMPICTSPQDGSDPQVVGVFQVINKLHGHQFTEEDERLLGSFLDIVGGLLQSSNLFGGNSMDGPKPTEFGLAQDLLSSQISPKRKNSTKHQNPFPDIIAEGAEGDEEEEEEEDDDA